MEVDVAQAAERLGFSKSWFYHLPKSTPGIYLYRRKLRVNLDELRAWAREQARSTGGGVSGAGQK